MILDDILELGKLELKDRKIKDAIIGLSIIAIQLDNGDIGSSYTLREELDGCCTIFPNDFQIIGMDAVEVAQWAVTEKNILKKALGFAALSAGCRNHYHHLQKIENVDYLAQVKETDVVGMIGYIGPIITALAGKTKDFIIFDKGKQNRCGVLSQDLQVNLLPTCDVVFISGTSFINNTIDELLKLCTKAREVVVIGSSTLVYPEAYQNYPVSIIAGSLWKKESKEDIFKVISLAGGIRNLSRYMDKISIRV
ncbi:MAG: Rossmann-like domain-containing protein [Bacillota bacterium]